MDYLKDYITETAEKLETGLVMVECPTGYGKSYQIAEFAKAFNEGKKIVYLTTQVKNCAAMVHDINGDSKDGEALWLRSNVDNVVDKLLDLTIPDEFKLGVYDELCKSIKKYKNSEKVADQEYLKTLREEIGKKDNKFRDEIRKKLGNEFSKKEKASVLLNVIKTNKNYKWIGELYPQVYTCEKQVLVMSVSKFLYRNDPIIEPEYKFLSKKFLKDKIVFIDEFDAAKGMIQSTIIEKAVDAKDDYIKLFLQVFRNLKPDTFSINSQLVTEMTDTNKNGEKKKQTLAKLIDEATEINEKYRTELSYKLEESGIDHKQNFLINDGTFNTIFQEDNKKYMRVSKNDTENINEIHIEDKDSYNANKKYDDIIIFNLLRDITTFF